ncbi:unnamed protein product, partial [Eruca vesicaria subsp. sativa]|nr:unnamed protein product [Eruca vesicaria subsp. sativa]
LIESRISTFHTAVQVSSKLDLVCVVLLRTDLTEEEEEDEGPVIYEDKDSDEEGGVEEAMETDEEADESEDEAADGVNGFD